MIPMLFHPTFLLFIPPYGDGHEMMHYVASSSVRPCLGLDRIFNFSILEFLFVSFPTKIII